MARIGRCQSKTKCPALQGCLGFALLGDQLGDLGIRAYWLDEEKLAGIEIHTVRGVQFFAALYEHIVGLLGIGIGLGDDVIDIREDGMR